MTQNTQPPKPLEIRPGRRIVSDLISISAGQASVLLARLVGVRVLTEILPTDAFGKVSLTVATAALGLTVFASPFIQAAMRRLQEAISENQIANLRLALYRLIAYAWLCFAAATVLAALVFDQGDSSVWPLALAALLLAAVDMYKTTEVGLLNAAHRQREFSVWNAADAWARPLFACLTIFLLGSGAFQTLIGYALGASLVSLLFAKRRVFAEGGASPGASDHGRRLLILAWPLVPFSACAWFIGVADRYALGALSGPEAVGVYVAAYGLASAPFMSLSSILLNIFRPRLFSAHTASDTRKAARIVGAWVGASLLLGCVGVVLIWGLRELIVAIALAKEFSSASDVLPIIAVAYLLQGIEVCFDTVLLSLEKSRLLLGVQVGGACVAVAAYIALIPQYGYLGAAWGTVVAQFASFSLATGAALVCMRKSAGRGPGA